MTYDLFYENYLNYNRDVRIAVGQEIDIDTNTKPAPPVPPTPEPKNAIYFQSKTGVGTYIMFTSISSKQSLEYSCNSGKTWTAVNAETQISISGDTKCYFRGKLTGDNTNDDYTSFQISSGNVKVVGNINALWNYEDLDQPLYAYCGNRLFDGCLGICDITELSLPALTAPSHCYAYMFQGCAIDTAPVLPATTLGWACYWYMFGSCRNLVNVPQNMLPATNLIDDCYGYTFNGCVSLNTAPELPATILASGCYGGMFCNCSSLEVAPDLNAETLVTNCYQSMFYCDTSAGASKLKSVKCLATNISSETTNSTTNWLYAASHAATSTPIFTKSASATEENWRTYGNVPNDWTIN